MIHRNKWLCDRRMNLKASIFFHSCFQIFAGKEIFDFNLKDNEEWNSENIKRLTQKKMGGKQIYKDIKWMHSNVLVFCAS